MMENIHIKIRSHKESDYYIWISKNLMSNIIDFCKHENYSDIALITDSNVKELYGNNLLAQFKENGLNALMVVFSAGEQSKTRGTKEKIEDYLIQNNFKRDSLIIALGGGVTGDLAGFIAATYMRGIDYIQIPTTLLAMVDSSIGGKTAVDTKDGKNMIGSFHQPKAVFIDIDSLKTLPKEEMINGISEIIKYGIIHDSRFFEFVQKNFEKILSLDEEILIKTIKWSCSIKKEYIEKDEKDESSRKALNFGHTIGHAVEKAANYKMKHGYAVAFGMIAETKIAVEKGLLNSKDGQQIIEIIKKIGIDKIPYDSKIIIENTLFDKKNSSGSVNYVLPRKIGRVDIDIPVDEGIIQKVLEELK